MARQLILNIYAEQALMQYWQGRQLLKEWPLAGPNQSGAALEEITTEAIDTPAIILVDIADEEFRNTQIPKVIGSARTRLVARSMNQAFPNMAYRSIESQGTIRDQRKDEKLLLMAITRGEWVDQWLTALGDHQIVIQRVTTASMALGMLARQFKWNNPSELVIYRHHDDGLRQLFINRGCTELSRLSLAPTGEQSLTDQFISEANTTRQYLNNSRAISRDATLTIRILHRPQMGVPLASTLSELQQVDLELVDINQAAAQLKLTIPTPEIRADHLLGWVATSSAHKLPDFSPAKTRHNYQRFANGRRLVLTASLITVAMLFWAATELFAVWKYASLAEEQQALLGRWQTLLETAETDKLPSDAPPIAMKQAIELSQQLSKQRRFPTNALTQLAVVLADQPDLRFRKIEWAAPNQPLDNYQLEPIYNDYDYDDDTAEPPEPPGETLFVELTIEPFNGNYLAAQRRAEQTVDALNHQPGVSSAKLISAPLDVNSSTQFNEQINLSGVGESVIPVARFRLFLALKNLERFQGVDQTNRATNSGVTANSGYRQ